MVNRLSNDSIKTCTKCGSSKSVSEFQKTDSNTSGYRSVCIDCKRKAGRAYSKEHPGGDPKKRLRDLTGWKKREKARAKRRKNRINSYLNGLKESTPCYDCGRKLPYYCVDFDHLDSSMKVKSLNRLRHAPSVSHIENEVNKCEVICANCHRTREASRRADMYASKVPQRVRNRELILNSKNVPCTDCGRSFGPSVMDFDHVRGQKLGSICQCAARFGKTKLLEEIMKCDVICAVCHRIRTHSRIGP